MTYGKDPLQRKRQSPSPLIRAIVGGISDTSDDDAANGPGHLESSCAGTSKSQRDNLGGISRSIGDEHAPRDTLQSLPDCQDRERIGLWKRLVNNCVLLS